MRFEYEHEGQLHVVDLRQQPDGRYQASWRLVKPPEEGEAEETTLQEKVLDLEVESPHEGRYSVLMDHRSCEIRVGRHGDERRVRTARGQVVFRHLDPYRARSGAGLGEADGRAEVASPMPGRVVELKVAVGDTVEEGQTLVIVEAMKMANEYRSPMTGTVSAVKVAAGDAVDAGTVLIVVEAADD
ncbi:MAG: biotin/lipoyl-containing protein [Acidobacteriota bacterium]